MEPSIIEQSSVAGKVLKGRYEIGELCGHGGMSHVYKGFDRLLGRAVAIKILTNHKEVDMVQRFEREAHLLSGLNHPNIASIYDFGEEEDKLFMVMEFVDGKSLYHFLDEDKPMPLERALRFMIQIGEGLAAAHEHKIVHRDIKPENVLVCQRETVRLIDFGLAVTYQQIHSNDRLTIHGYCVGTQRYMSPEQKEGKVPTPATDIYAFGLVCAELLAGSCAVSAGMLQPVENLPVAVKPYWPIIQKACHEKPSRRWTTVNEMMDAVKAMMSETPLKKQIIHTKHNFKDALTWLVGTRKQERVLALVSCALLVFVGIGWKYATVINSRPSIKINPARLSWLPKNIVHLQITGLAERANPTKLFLETSVYDKHGELLPDPTTTIIDKNLQFTNSVAIDHPIQALDQDYRFKIPPEVKQGYIRVKLMDETKMVISEEQVPFSPPVIVKKKK